MVRAGRVVQAGVESRAQQRLGEGAQAPLAHHLARRQCPASTEPADKTGSSCGPTPWPQAGGQPRSRPLGYPDWRLVHACMACRCGGWAREGLLSTHHTRAPCTDLDVRHQVTFVEVRAPFERLVGVTDVGHHPRQLVQHAAWGGRAGSSMRVGAYRHDERHRQASEQAQART